MNAISLTVRALGVVVTALLGLALVAGGWLALLATLAGAGMDAMSDAGPSGANYSDMGAWGVVWVGVGMGWLVWGVMRWFRPVRGWRGIAAPVALLAAGLLSTLVLSQSNDVRLVMLGAGAFIIACDAIDRWRASKDAAVQGA